MALLNVFGADGPKGLIAFVPPPREDFDDFKIIDHIGKTGIFTVRGPKQVDTTYGPKTVVNVDVTIVETEQSFEDVLIFNKAPNEQLMPLAGQTVVAAIVGYPNKNKKGELAPRLEAPSAEAQAAAEKLAA